MEGFHGNKLLLHLLVLNRNSPALLSSLVQQDCLLLKLILCFLLLHFESRNQLLELHHLALFHLQTPLLLQL